MIPDLLLQLLPMLTQFTKMSLLAISLAIALRIARVPDFGVFGTFALSAAVAGYAYEISSSLVYSVLLSALSFIPGALIFLVGFLKLKIHSLAASLIYLMMTGGIMFAVNGGRANRSISNEITSSFPIVKDLVLPVGVSLSIIVVCSVLIFLSTTRGSSLIIGSSSPKLATKIGINPSFSIITLIAISHFIAAIGGSFYILSTGTISMNFVAQPLIPITISLILGEISLLILLNLSNRRNRRNKNNTATKNSTFNIIFSACSAWFYIVSAIIGVFLYYTIFKILTFYFEVGDYLPLIISFTILFLFFFVSKNKSTNSDIMNWDIHGYRTW